MGGELFGGFFTFGKERQGRGWWKSMFEIDRAPLKKLHHEDRQKDGHRRGHQGQASRQECHSQSARQVAGVFIVNPCVTVLSNSLINDRIHQSRQTRIDKGWIWAAFVSSQPVTSECLCSRSLAVTWGMSPGNVQSVQSSYSLAFSYCISELHIVMSVLARNFSTKWIFFSVFQ